MAASSHGQAPLPSFLIIGAERSATRWLRFNLDRHPEIFAPPLEINWFSDPDRVKVEGRRAYHLKFDAWRGEEILGESSASYLKLTNEPVELADRIGGQLPDARLVAILRQPVDRMLSAIRMYIKRGRLPADVDPYDLILRHDPVVDELDLIGAGLYTACLYPFLQRFGDQVLVVLHDDVRDHPEEVYASVLRHVGAQPDFVPSGLGEVRFSDRPTIALPELADEQRRILHMAFRRDLEELEAMIHRDLSSWDPGPPPWDRAGDVQKVLAAIPPTGPLPDPTADASEDDLDDLDVDVDAEAVAGPDAPVATATGT